MSTVCADQQHKLLLSPKSKPYCAFKDIEIPPRKLLLNTKNHPHRRHHHHHPHHHHQADYASAMLFSDETADSLPYKFLPFNNADGDSDSESDPYASDHFRMYEFKIRRCTRSRSHDWTDCPFAHPGEKARRRDPRRYHYSGTVCSEYRRGGGCSRGDDCEFAHGVFECWLHPSRYRTEACKDGKNCKRKVCFFAHSPRQLRILPELPVSSSPKHSNNNSANILHSLSPHRDSPANQHKNHCCMYCCHTMNSSPTSTLLSNLSHLSRSPSMSPPISPVKHGFSPMSSRHGGGCSGSCGGGGGFTDCLNKFGAGNADMASSMSYKEMLNELMSSLDAMSFGNELSSPGGSSGGGGGGVMNNVNVNVPWFDPNSFNGVEDQTQFVLSPSTPNYPANSAADQSAINPFGGKVHRSYSNNKSKFVNDDQKFVNDNNNNDNNNGGSSLPNGTDPDLGWVNDLLT